MNSYISDREEQIIHLAHEIQEIRNYIEMFQRQIDKNEAEKKIQEEKLEKLLAKYKALLAD